MSGYNQANHELRAGAAVSVRAFRSKASAFLSSRPLFGHPAAHTPGSEFYPSEWIAARAIAAEEGVKP